jgi:hypothetical protein
VLKSYGADRRSGYIVVVIRGTIGVSVTDRGMTSSAYTK